MSSVEIQFRKLRKAVAIHEIEFRILMCTSTMEIQFRKLRKTHLAVINMLLHIKMKN